MAKAKKEPKVQKTVKPNFFNKFNLEEIIPSKYHILFAALIILILFLIFLNRIYFGGKTFQSGDIITGNSYTTIKETTNHHLLWNPYIFCGLPSQVSGVGYTRWFDLINTSYSSLREAFGNLFNNDYTQHTVFLIFLAFSAYYFMKQKSATTLVCLYVAVATAFSTGIIVFLFIGHITKLNTLAVFPIVLIILFKFQEKIKLIDIIVLAVSISFLLAGWHIQMIFYSYFAIGLFYLFFFVRFIFNKQFNDVIRLLKSLAVLIITSIIALSTAIDMYAQIQEYTEYSTRGTKSITELQSGETRKSQSDFYEYATSWSFSPGEITTFIVPSFYGFGNVIYKGPLSNNEEVEVNTYFGQMPFVDVAMYMGVIVFFLGLFGMYAARKQPIVQYLSLLAIISLLISFGKNFSPMFDFMFYYFPFFDKFRVPSMILTLVQISMPILAGFGIMEILSLRNNKNQRLLNVIKYSAIGFTSLLVLSFFLNGPITNWFTARLAESTRGQQISQIGDFVAEIFMRDLYLALFFSAVTFSAAYAYINNKLSKDILILVLLLLTTIDLFRISGRGAKFVDKQNVSGLFAEPSHISAIKSQNDNEIFRMLNLKQDGSLGSFGQNSNYNMYFLIQDLAGYSGIKPRSYQDYIDVVGPANPTLWRMLNVKYCVFDNKINARGFVPILEQENNYVYKNENALPRAYFVNHVEKKEAIDVLNDVKNNRFDPQEVAFVSEQLTLDKPDSTAYVKIQSYGNERIIIDANASGNNFMFLGDTFYPHGWEATIDGKSTNIYRVNHGFRGIIIPKGKHKIEFTYTPKSYYLGKYVSLSANIILLLGLLLGIYLNTKKSKEIKNSR